MALAQSGDTIEIRGNGPFLEGPIRIHLKALVIRAGVSFRPVLHLTPEHVKQGSEYLFSNAAACAGGPGIPSRRRGGATTLDVPRQFSRDDGACSPHGCELPVCHEIEGRRLPGHPSEPRRMSPGGRGEQAFLSTGYALTFNFPAKPRP